MGSRPRSRVGAAIMHVRAAPASSHLKPAAPSFHYQPLVIVLCGVVAGILVDRGYPLSCAAWWGGSAAALCLWFVLLVMHLPRVANAALLVGLGCLAGGWHHFHWNLFPAGDIATWASETPRPVAVRGVAITGSRRIPAPPFDPLVAFSSGDRTRIDLRPTEIRDGLTWVPCAGRATLVVEGHVLGVHAGDTLEVFAMLSRSGPAANPGDLDFATLGRARRSRCLLRASFPDCVQIIGQGSRWSVTRWIDELRQWGSRTLWRYLGSEHAGLEAALLLGAREQLDEQRTEAFFATNTIHVLAISGLHIGMLATAMFWALRLGLLPRRHALIAVALLVVVYTLVTGAPPSAVRAAILVVLVCVSLAWGKNVLGYNCLAAAALVVLAINPADLFRAGPQLSFLAVGTLIWFGPHWMRWQQQDALDRLIERSRSWPWRLSGWLGRWFLRATAVTAVVWASTLPLVMARFNLVSPVAILLTTLLWLPIAIALLSGFALLVAAAILPIAAPPLAWLCGTSLTVVDFFVQQAAAIPYGHAWLPGPEEPWLAGFYIGLLAWCGTGPWRLRPRLALVLMAAWIAVGVAFAWPGMAWNSQAIEQRAGRELRCTFLAVGHGCSIVLELPDGRTLLYDAGRLGSPSSGARTISRYLWSRGIRRLDAVLISHADVDHYNALPLLLKQFEVGEVFVGPQMFADEDSLALAALKTAVDRHSIPIRIVHNHAEVLGPADSESPQLRLLHPPPEAFTGSDNSASLVLAIEYQGVRLLLPGDLEPPGTAMLLGQAEYDVDVLLAPHHGSQRSDPPGFVRWSQPELIVISGGDAIEAAPVMQTYQSGGAQVLHTDAVGAVIVVVREGSYQVRHWIEGPQ